MLKLVALLNVIYIFTDMCSSYISFSDVIKHQFPQFGNFNVQHEINRIRTNIKQMLKRRGDIPTSKGRVIVKPTRNLVQRYTVTLKWAHIKNYKFIKFIFCHTRKNAKLG